MANIAVFASGNGSNFQAIAEHAVKAGHKVPILVCNKKSAYAFKRAENLKIPSYYISYNGRSREDTEKEILSVLQPLSIDLIALAGFMKLLTSYLINAFPNRIINIHPSLLPEYPGTDAIKKSFFSTDKKLGITIHKVDAGLDTGRIILQKEFTRSGKENIEEIENNIHKLEHKYYPEMLINILNKIDKKRDLEK